MPVKIGVLKFLGELGVAMNGAGDGDRTRDIQLGKLAFYR
jgi:hypothetical protein